MKRRPTVGDGVSFLAARRLRCRFKPNPAPPPNDADKRPNISARFSTQIAREKRVAVISRQENRLSITSHRDEPGQSSPPVASRTVSIHRHLGNDGTHL